MFGDENRIRTSLFAFSKRTTAFAIGEMRTLWGFIPSRHRLARIAVGGSCATLAGTLAQLKYLHSQYEPLQEPSGPMQGVAAYWRERRQQGAAAITGLRRPFISHGTALIEPPPSRQQQQQPQPHEPSASPAAPRPRKNILFIGDSLVTGVGCDRETGPAMPRACAEFLARTLHVDVQWTAIGKTGEDVAGLAQLLPAVGSAVRQAQAAGDRIDLVVVICGLNDFKYAYQGLGRTASGFRATLSSLVDSIHQETGKGCPVVLPALPITYAPVFGGDWPVTVTMRMLLANIAALWDEQKEALCKLPNMGGRISFVRNQPAEDAAFWHEVQYWARDGIHPNDKGYTVWGEHIAQGIVRQALLTSPVRG